MGWQELTNTVVALDVDDRGWPVVVVHPVHSRTGSKASHLLLRLDSILGREQRFGLVFDLGAADPGAGVLVETALAGRASRMAERCVGAATVIRTDAGTSRRLAAHPVLFPFPSVSKPSVDEAVAWVADRLGRPGRRDLGN